MVDVLNNSAYIKIKWGNKGGKKRQVTMINGDFTGFPKISYYFTSEEGQPRKKCMCMYVHIQIYIQNHSRI